MKITNGQSTHHLPWACEIGGAPWPIKSPPTSVRTPRFRSDRKVRYRWWLNEPTYLKKICASRQIGSFQPKGMKIKNIWNHQWLFLVPLKGGRSHIIPQLAVYTTYILPSGGLYATYHLDYSESWDLFTFLHRKNCDDSSSGSCSFSILHLIDQRCDRTE